MTWMLFWKIVFVAVLSLFAVMSGLTIIFGAKDVRKLLREFEAETEEKQRWHRKIDPETGTPEDQ
jgi:hypothetical protein